MNLDQLTDARAPVYEPRVARRPNLRALTSVRFFAALHVALYHLVRPLSQWGPLQGALSDGFTGVSFFFVLSGYILTYSHADEYEAGRGTPKKFWTARFARIYPVYLLSLVYAGIVGRAEFHQKVHALAFAMDIFLVQSWSARAVNFFNSPAWTISVEAFFYLCFPFLLMRLRPSSTSKAVLATCAFWLMALAVPLFCLLRYPVPAWNEFAVSSGTGASVVFNVERLPIMMLPEFLAGISLGWLNLKFPPSRRTSSLLVTLGLLLLVPTLMLGDRLPHILLHNGLLLPMFGMLLVGLSQENWLTKLLSNSFLVLLGEASFSLYLFHILFRKSTDPIFGSALTLRSAMEFLPLVIALSVLLHLFLERPCRKAILRWALRS